MNKTTNDDMNEYWNGDGGHKWVVFQDRLDASLKHFGREVMATATISAGEGVIDIGCGCGDTSLDIARRVGSNGYVLGIDISEPILVRAKIRSLSVTKSNVTFTRADAQTHHFEPSAFNVVFSRFGVMFFDDPVSAFRNIRRALKSGGRMAFICWQPAEENEWIRLPLEVVNDHIPLPSPPEPEHPGPLSFGDRSRVMRILKKAGFKKILMEKFESTLNVGSNLDEAVEFLTLMGPASGALSQPDVNDIDKSRINSELRNRLTPHETKHGITLGATAWIVSAENP